MGRLAGAVARDTGPGGAAAVARMLDAVRAEAWSSAVLREGPAAVGWTGWTSPQLAVAHGVLVCVDGRLYGAAPEPDAAERVAGLYRRDGFARAVASLEGDFAIALYDPRAATLWLARDRAGSRPLYHARWRDGYAFASRPRSLWELPGVSRDVRREYVALVAAGHYRHFDARPEASPFVDIAQLPAGCVAEIRGGDVRVTRYWALDEAPDQVGSEAELAARYRELLIASVRRRLPAGERPAFTLSGGMDSSSVVAAAAHVMGAPVIACSVVYDDPTFDEREGIRAVADSLVAEWIPVRVGAPDVLDLVRRMVREHDEPVATATWLSHFVLCEEVARRGFHVLFGGLGGDELNAGEYEYFPYHFADLRAQGREDELRHEIDRWAIHHDHPVFRKSARAADDLMARLVDPAHPGRCLPDRRRLLRYRAALDPAFFRLEAFDPPMGSPFTSYLRSRAYHDLVRETLPCCLRAQDRNGSRHGIDHVLPFLDREVIALMFRVPGSMKIRDGVTKRLLREATRGLLPDETRERIAKVGWNAPAHVWFSGSGGEMVLDLVRSSAFRGRGIYDVAEVERIVREHDEIVRAGVPREDHMMFLWQLVNLELWLEEIERYDRPVPDHAGPSRER